MQKLWPSMNVEHGDKEKKKELLLNCVEGGPQMGVIHTHSEWCELDTPTLMGSKLAKKNTHPTCSLFNIIVYNTIHTYIHTYKKKQACNKNWCWCLVMVVELASSCKQQMMVTSWGEWTGQDEYMRHWIIKLVTSCDFLYYYYYYTHNTLAWKSLSLCVYYHNSRASNVVPFLPVTKKTSVTCWLPTTTLIERVVSCWFEQLATYICS